VTKCNNAPAPLDFPASLCHTVYMKKQTAMRPVLLALAALCVGAAASALPVPPLPPVDYCLMTTVPNFGPSRVETVSACLSDAGVPNYQNLITDSDWETFTDCMNSNT